VQARVADLERQLAHQRTDRVRANERCREAGRLVAAADHGLAMARPDLRQVAQVLDAADAAAARATDLAAEDERLARQAIEDLEEADSLVRRVAAWYAEGVSANVQPASAALEQAKALLTQQRYEDSIKTAAEATHSAKEAYAAATAEADRRRHRRQLEIQRRQMEESFARMSRGFGPWVIQLPGGTFTGPDPWRSMRSGRGGGIRMPSIPASRSSGGGWSSNTTQVGW
jgi:ribosomal protein S14